MYTLEGNIYIIVRLYTKINRLFQSSEIIPAMSPLFFFLIYNGKYILHNVNIYYNVK